MKTKDLARLERFTAAALTGLCANNEFLKIVANVDKENNFEKGTSLVVFATDIGAKTARFLDKYANEQSSTTA